MSKLALMQQIVLLNNKTIKYCGGILFRSKGRRIGEKECKRP